MEVCVGGAACWFVWRVVPRGVARRLRREGTCLFNFYIAGCAKGKLLCFERHGFEACAVTSAYELGLCVHSHVCILRRHWYVASGGTGLKHVKSREVIGMLPPEARV